MARWSATRAIAPSPACPEEGGGAMHSLTLQLCSLPCSQGRVGVGRSSPRRSKALPPPNLPLQAGGGAMQEQPHPAPALPPLLAGKGWGGVALRLEDQKLYPLPTSPCKQGEEQRSISLTPLLCSLPCSQGRVGVGSLFASKIKSFTTSQPPPASRGRSNARAASPCTCAPSPASRGRSKEAAALTPSAVAAYP